MTYDKNEDYCTLSPDGLFGVRFNYSCYLHDRQYRNEVKERKTRKQADVDFRKTIQKIYKTSNDPFKFDVLGYIKHFFKLNKTLLKILEIKSSNKLLIWFRNNILGWFVSWVYYYAVHLFAGKAWIKE